MLHDCDEYFRVNCLSHLIECQVAQQVYVLVSRISQFDLDDVLSDHEIKVFKLELPTEHIFIDIPLGLQLVIAISVQDKTL